MINPSIQVMIPSSFKKLLACAFLSLIALGSSAQALMIGDAFYLGKISPNNPSSPTDEVSYINALNDLAAGAGDTGPILGQTFNRVSSTLAGPFSEALLAGATKEEPTDGSLELVTPTEYIYGKYGGFALVWYNPAGFTGTVTVPTAQLSHLSTYQATTTSVPDGGATLALLGLGLGAIGFAGRKLKK